MPKYTVHFTIGRKKMRTVINAATPAEAANTVRMGLRIQTVEPAPPEAKENTDLASLKRIMNQLTDLWK